MWDTWKKSFETWEGNTATFLEGLLKNPALLEPAGAALTAVARLKAASDRAVGMFWSAIGLPSKRDQERTLHALNKLESLLLDLEEKLEKRA